MAAYYRPDTLEDALDVLSTGSVTIAAGCTDLFPATQNKVLPGSVLDITAIKGLRGIEHRPNGVMIGATTTWLDLIRAELPPAFDMLKLAAREVGSVQIQAAGTIAGNLCNASPAADGVPCLMALDAEVELSSRTGRRHVALGEFISGPRKTLRAHDEIVTGIFVPSDSTSGASHFVKLGARAHLVISIAMVAARLTIRKCMVEDVSIAVGSCSAVATRLPLLERRLIGQDVASLSSAIEADLIAPALSPIDDIRADAAYRSDAATELVRRALSELIQDREVRT